MLGSFAISSVVDETASSTMTVDESVWKKMIEEADLDGDGEISLDEFEKLMTTLLYSN
jgi:Ca2+-binding EF-hand superfamily protein